MTSRDMRRVWDGVFSALGPRYRKAIMPTPDSLRISSQLTGTQGSVSVGLASGQFIAANANRVALIIFAPPTTAFTLSSGAAVVGAGYVVPTGAAPTVLRVEDYGSWLTGVLNAITTGGAETVSFIEVTTLAKG